MSVIDVHSQSSKAVLVEDADEHFRVNQFVAAIPIYKAELKKDPYNVDLKYRLGICYINSRLNRSVALQYLEEASREPGMEDEVWMHLGKAYHLLSRIDDAVNCYEKFAKLKPKRADEVEHYLEQCEYARVFMKKPVKVSFQNLGKDINSAEPDYYPFIDKDESTLLFTTRRKENIGGKKAEADGYRSSDIYQSNMLSGEWTKAKNIGKSVNTKLDEQIVGLSPDGLEMYLYLDHIEKYGDLYVAKRKDFDAEFSKPKIVDPVINEQIESSGCMNEEGNLIIFARRSKTNGNSDLYVSRLLPSGKWGIPQPLPPEINTPYNEDMPYLSYDGNTLYFSSEGHSSMGGYDLFKCSWNQTDNVFTKPINLGFPVNSPDDERSICVTRDNKLAYVSAFRPNGFGDLDLYRVKFSEEDPVNVIYIGNVFLGDSVQNAQVTDYDVKIMVTDVATNYEYLFVPQHNSGRFVIALPAGSYKLMTYCKGYVRHKEEFTVSDMGPINLERHKDLKLRRLKKAGG